MHHKNYWRVSNESYGPFEMHDIGLQLSQRRASYKVPICWKSRTFSLSYGHSKVASSNLLAARNGNKKVSNGNGANYGKMRRISTRVRAS